MIFNEIWYAFFLIPAVILFHLVPVRWRPWVLVLAGTAFYGYYARVFLVLIGVEIAFVWLLTRELQEQKWMFGAALAITLGALGYFKYRNMLVLTVAGVGDLVGWHYSPIVSRLVLPLAISFFTFEFVHYIVDCRKGTIPKHNLVDFLAFVMFFPTMVSGPIKRFQDFQPRVAEARLTADNLGTGVVRIVVGLFRKMVIADTLDYWTRHMTTDLTVMSTLGLWIAVFAFSIKIYMDFAGYSDIAIGSALLFGIKVPENFLQPFFKPNMAQFWRAWHASLYKWIVDYVFIPLGGSRRRERRVALNTIAAMTVSGIWHGAAWNYVLWGLYHGVLLAGYRFFQRSRLPLQPKGLLGQRVVYLASVAMTFLAFTVGLIIFGWPVSQLTVVIPRMFWDWR